MNGINFTSLNVSEDILEVFYSVVYSIHPMCIHPVCIHSYWTVTSEWENQKSIFQTEGL